MKSSPGFSRSLPIPEDVSSKNKVAKKRNKIISVPVIVASVTVSTVVIISVAIPCLYLLQYNKSSACVCQLGALNQSINENYLTNKRMEEIRQGYTRQLKTNIIDYLAIKRKLQQYISYALNASQKLPPAQNFSCADIQMKDSALSSGYYWIESANGSSIRVYCDMTRMCGGVTGGWMRVAELNMTRTSSRCPPSLCLNIAHPRACRICSHLGACSLDIYPVGVSYSRVCGRVIGYQKGTPDAFSMTYSNGMDGVDFSYGNPRKNIWAFAAAVSETNYIYSENICRCINQNDANIPAPPIYFENYYFCDTGLLKLSLNPSYVTSDPLWDGAGCGSRNTCCSFNNPPWFYRELPHPTADDIEMRVCRDETRINEDIAIEVIDVYVQ